MLKSLKLPNLLKTSQLVPTWNALRDKPFGKQVFSRVVSMAAPYTATIGAQIEELAPGRARVE